MTVRCPKARGRPPVGDVGVDEGAGQAPRPERRKHRAPRGLLGERAVRIRAGHKRVLRVRVPRARRRLIRLGADAQADVQAWLGEPAATAVQRPVQAARASALIVLVAVGLRLVYGPGHLGYDAVWSSGRGREALAGPQPELRGVPRPDALLLANALLTGCSLPSVRWRLAVVMAPLAGRSRRSACSGFLLGRRLFSVWVGVAFAVVVLTRHPVDPGQTHQAGC